MTALYGLERELLWSIALLITTAAWLWNRSCLRRQATAHATVVTDSESLRYRIGELESQVGALVDHLRSVLPADEWQRRHVDRRLMFEGLLELTHSLDEIASASVTDTVGESQPRRHDES